MRCAPFNFAEHDNLSEMYGSWAKLNLALAVGLLSQKTVARFCEGSFGHS